MRSARERVRRVPLGAVRQVPGPQGGGEGGGEGGRQEAALISSLSSLANGDGGKDPPPPTSANGCHHSYYLSQSKKQTIKLHHIWMLQLRGNPQPCSFQFQNWTGLLQASELAKLYEKE